MMQDDFAKFVSDENEFAEAVTYTRYADGSTLQTTAIFEQIDFNEKQDEGRMINDNLFAYIALDSKPEVYDSVLYDGEEWRVKSFRKTHGGYKIELSREDRKTHKHTKGRFR